MTPWDAMLAAYARETPPEAAYYSDLTDEATAMLRNETQRIRPAAANGSPGGMVLLDTGMPTIVVPDLHARRGFFMSLMANRLAGGMTVMEALEKGKLQILCLGDGFHAEGRAAGRWQAAYGEFLDGFRERAAMDAEMAESMGLMEMVMLAKTHFPERFHFLKGNHENVLNEEGAGNHPFRKFVLEGMMVYSYLEMRYGTEFIYRYAQMEKSLPVFAEIGRASCRERV